VPYERAFFDLVAGAPADRIAASPHRDIYAGAEWAPVLERLRAARPAPQAGQMLSHAYLQRDAPSTLLIEEVEALWADIADRDDWSGLQEKIEEIRLAGDCYTGLAPASAD
jgi:hypothetical protein